MQEMQTSMAVSKNVLRSFRLTTEDSAQMQVRKMSSEIATLQRTEGNTITQRPSQYQPSERSEVGTSLVELQTPTAISQRSRQYYRPERGLQKECNSMLGKEKTPLLDS